MAIHQQVRSALLLLVVSPGVALAQEPTTPAASANTVKTERLGSNELKEKQIDVSLETRDIERILGKLKKASDLAKSRITEAAVTTEAVTADLDRGDSATARTDAKQATEMFAEIILQLQALLKEETPQQIAEAKQLAKQLAKMEREFAEKYEGMLNPVGTGKGKVDPKSKPSTEPNEKGGGEGGESQVPAGGGKKKDPASGSDDPKSGTNPATPPKPAAGTGDNKQDPKEGSDKTEAGGGSAKKKSDQPANEGTAGSENNKNDRNNKDKTESGGTGDPQGNEDKKGDDKKGGGGMSPEELREALARRAERLSETGKTLQDVLNAIARSTDPADKDATARIQEVLKEVSIDKLVEQMGQIGGMVRSKKDTDAKLSSQDIADRLEIMAQRLDAAYQLIVAPQAEELRKVEQDLVELRRKLEELQTEAQIAAWHREARELLDRAEKLGISDRVRDALLEEMKKAGLSTTGKMNEFNWALVNNLYIAPSSYNKPLLDLQEELQARIQSLLLGDLLQESDDATPPKYQELVEQYYKVLSRQGGQADTGGKSAPAMKTPIKKTDKPK